MSPTRNPAFWYLAGLLITGLPSVTLSAQNCTPFNDFKGEFSELLIGDISINADDVFDESRDLENKKIHKVTNKLHVNTLPGVIRRQLLFKPGDQYHNSSLAENERILRANRYIRLAQIKPVEVCNNLVSIEVNTSDNWTLTPGLSYGRSGGLNQSSIEMKDSNLLGWGKTLQLKIAQTVDREERILHYFDPQLLASRNQLDLRFHNNSDGYLNAVSLIKPFSALSSENSWATSMRNEERVDPFYKDGEIAHRYQIIESEAQFSASRAKQLSENSVFRYGLGFKFVASSIKNISVTDVAAIRRTFSGPTLNLEYLQSNYITRHNLKHMDSIEDVSLGHRATFQLGWSNTAFGADENTFPFSASYEKGFKLSDSTLGFLELNTEGNYQKTAGFQNTILSAKSSIYLKQSDRFSFLAKGQATFGANLHEYHQLVLGGENGLRGYPISFQSGNATALLTLEQRAYFNWYPFSLMRFGGAIFADIGTSWNESQRRNKTLKDIGLGLRIVPTRHSRRGVIHMDIAMPLDDSDEISGVQLLIKTKSEF